jgi:hypothetical protein
MIFSAAIYDAVPDNINFRERWENSCFLSYEEMQQLGRIGEAIYTLEFPL